MGDEMTRLRHILCKGDLKLKFLSVEAEFEPTWYGIGGKNYKFFGHM
jgi:hypothetical protein